MILKDYFILGPKETQYKYHYWHVSKINNNNNSNNNRRHSLYTHGWNSTHGCVSSCNKVVLVLVHFDGVQPVTNGDEEGIVRKAVGGVGETRGDKVRGYTPESTSDQTVFLFVTLSEWKNFTCRYKDSWGIVCPLILTQSDRWLRTGNYWGWVWIYPRMSAHQWRVDADSALFASSAASVDEMTGGSQSVLGDDSPPQWTEWPGTVSMNQKDNRKSQQLACGKLDLNFNLWFCPNHYFSLLEINLSKSGISKN